MPEESICRFCYWADGQPDWPYCSCEDPDALFFLCDIDDINIRDGIKEECPCWWWEEDNSPPEFVEC